MAKKNTEFYVDNVKFTQALIDYGYKVRAAKEAGEDIPRANNYIGHCILRICTGVSMRHNFINYSYRDVMVSDAVHNCVKATIKFDPDAATRSGKPNAHGYFTQIAYFAMVRTIKDHAKIQDDMISYIQNSGIENFISSDDMESQKEVIAFINELRKGTSDFESEKKERSSEHYGWSKPVPKDD